MLLQIKLLTLTLVEEPQLGVDLSGQITQVTLTLDPQSCFLKYGSDVINCNFGFLAPSQARFPAQIAQGVAQTDGRNIFGERGDRTGFLNRPLGKWWVRDGLLEAEQGGG
jgi:hypothetical protein